MSARGSTYRAETIAACADAARRSGHGIIAHMPRMAEFYRRRVNEQLRAARAARDDGSVRDARAKLELLRWAECWCRGPIDTWSGRDSQFAGTMDGNLAMVGYALRHLVEAYADHRQFRPEWR